MWSSRDIALVIVLGVVGLSYGIFVVQIAMMLTGAREDTFAEM